MKCKESCTRTVDSVVPTPEQCSECNHPKAPRYYVARTIPILLNSRKIYEL
jgi:hypothetical protein